MYSDYELFRLNFEQSKVAKLLLDAQGRLLAANQASLDYFGYAEPDLLNQPFASLFHHAEPELDSLVRHSVAALENSFHERRFLHKSGMAIWGRLHLIHMAHSPQACYLAEIQDLSSYKFFQEAHALEQLRLKEAENLAQLGSWEHDFASGVSQCSDTARHLLGLVSAEPLTGPLWTSGAFLAEDAARCEAQLAACLNGQTDFGLEARLQRAQGEIRRIKLFGQLRRSESGEPLGLSGFLLDVTSLRAQEALLTETNRLLQLQNQALKQLAHQVYFHLKSSLTSIEHLLASPDFGSDQRI